MLYRFKGNFLLDGKRYKSKNGIIDLPKKVDGLESAEKVTKPKKKD